MLYGNCIFSQSRTPGFQSFLREHGSPDGAPSTVLASVFKGSDSQYAEKNFCRI